MLGNDYEKAGEILGSYLKMYKELTAHDPFRGFPRDRSVVGGSPKGDINDRDIASNAIIGIEGMKYMQYMNAHPGLDNTYDPKQYETMLKSVFALLDSRHHKGGLVSHPRFDNDGLSKLGKYAEPNAIVWAFMNAYANTNNSNEARSVADDILTWVSSLDMRTASGLIKNAEGEDDPSLDANSRWLIVLGPKLFIEKFGMSQKAFADYLDNVYATFNVPELGWNVDTASNEPEPGLMDLAGPEQAKAARGMFNNKIMRVGFPEPTAEMSRAFYEASQYLHYNKFAEISRKYNDQLSILSNGSLSFRGIAHSTLS